MTDTIVREELPSVRAVRLAGGRRVWIRPIRPDDADRLQGYVRGLSGGSRYNRFLGALNELSPAELARATRTDDPHRLALIAQGVIGGRCVVVGEARLAFDPDTASCEFALSVADAWQGIGLGARLLSDLECRARMRGARRLFGDTLRTNLGLQRLVRKAGFDLAAYPGDARLLQVAKELQPRGAAMPSDPPPARRLAA